MRCLLSVLICGLLVVAAAGCAQPEERTPRTAAVSVIPPDWARDAVWYQVFVERFENGDPSNDPTLADIDGSWPHVQPANWRVKEWTSDWHTQSAWEAEVSDDFYYSVQLRRYGGDLQGVIDRLDYIKSLGVTAIYLNPINDSPSLHKYDARNYRHVDRNFGPDPEGDAALMATEDPLDPATWKWTAADELFLELIEEAHDRDMRVIVDYSWNHTGMTFWAFRDVVENQAASPYADWYRINSFDDPATDDDEFEYVGWAGVRELPDLTKSVPDDDYDRRPLDGDLHPGPKALAFDVTERWMDPNGDGDPSDGVDGFRLDVAEMVPLGFWRDYRRHVKAINPDAYLVGEIWWEDWPETMLDPRPWIGDVFDAVMNYRWYMPTRSFVTGAQPLVSATTYRTHLDSVEAGIERSNLEAMMNVAASHDSPRLATSLLNRGRYKYHMRPPDDPDFKAGGPDEITRDLQRVLLMQQYTYYGAPHIWAGDELGMWGGDDPDNRKPIWWPEMAFPGDAGADTTLLAYYRELGEMRQELGPLLSRGAFKLLFAYDSQRAVGYERNHGENRAFVVLNAGETALDVDLSEFGSPPADRFEVILGTQAVSLDGSRLLLGPRSAVTIAVRRSGDSPA